MQIRNRLFPYPVLNHNTDYSNYLDCSFKLLFDQEEDETNCILKNIRYETNSSFINKLAEDNKISVVCIVECSYTVFRKKYFISNKAGQDLLLNKNDFSEKVIISMFAFAKEDINIYSDEFEEDYRDIEFEIEKNDILAANDGYSLFFKHEEEEDNLAQSIFNIINVHDLKESTFSPDFESRKITICLSDEEYKKYRIIYSAPEYKEAFFCMMLVPVLSDGLTKCIDVVRTSEQPDIEDVGNKYLWFRSIQNAYERLHGNALDLETLDKISPIELSQELLGKPLGIALQKLIDERNKTLLEEGDNE